MYIKIIFLASAHHVLKVVCKTIHDNAHLFIQWPARETYEAISETFSFPETIGKQLMSKSGILSSLYDYVYLIIRCIRWDLYSYKEANCRRR